MNVADKFVYVTELPGTPISREQFEKNCSRYSWAAGFCANKRVLELGCGAGQGLGCLGEKASVLIAGDQSQYLLETAKSHYRGRVDFVCLDAQSLPFSDASFDVIVMFEAIYYLPSAAKFIAEAKRVLNPGGTVLIATANKELYDFNPSRYSVNYYGVKELSQLFVAECFDTEFLGETRIDGVSRRQKVLRPIRKLAVALNLIPKTMKGKRWLKRLVFGRLQPMPAELKAEKGAYSLPKPIPGDRPDTEHKTIFCVATLK